MYLFIYLFTKSDKKYMTVKKMNISKLMEVRNVLQNSIYKCLSLNKSNIIEAQPTRAVYGNPHFTLKYCE